MGQSQQHHSLIHQAAYLVTRWLRPDFAKIFPGPLTKSPSALVEREEPIAEQYFYATSTS